MKAKLLISFYVCLFSSFFVSLFFVSEIFIDYLCKLYVLPSLFALKRYW